MSGVKLNSPVFQQMAPTIKFSPVYGERELAEKEGEKSDATLTIPWRIPINDVLGDINKNIVHSIVTSAGFTVMQVKYGIPACLDWLL